MRHICKYFLTVALFIEIIPCEKNGTLLLLPLLKDEPNLCQWIAVMMIGETNAALDFTFAE
jgi:hypothetical protein